MPLAALACTVVAVLSWVAAFRIGSLQEVDRDLLTAFLEFGDGSRTADGIARGLYRALHPLVLAALVAAAACAAFVAGERRRALAAAACFVAANVLAQALQQLTFEPRSHDVLYMEEVAWPSGHAAAVVAAAAAIAIALRRPALAAAAGAFAFLDCLAILVIHHHFPSDVVGGAAVAGAVAFLARGSAGAGGPRRYAAWPGAPRRRPPRPEPSPPRDPGA